MTLATEVRKLTASKPFYAVAGMGDYAVEKLRELPDRLEKLQARRGEFRETALRLPDKARSIAVTLPEKAREYAEAAGNRAAELYEEFAVRGREVVSRITGETALELENASEAAAPTTPKPATRKTTKS